MLHPGAFYGHGPRQVLAWLSRYRRAGFRVVEPSGWRGLVAAADVLIGDHGSATVYAAAAGVPVLRAGAASDFIAPGSAGDLLFRSAPVVSPALPLADQLTAARLAGPDGRIARAVSSVPPGRAGARLRGVMYRLMGLAEPCDPGPPPPVALPVLADR